MPPKQKISFDFLQHINKLRVKENEDFAQLDQGASELNEFLGSIGSPAGSIWKLIKEKIFRVKKQESDDTGKTDEYNPGYIPLPIVSGIKNLHSDTIKQAHMVLGLEQDDLKNISYTEIAKSLDKRRNQLIILLHPDYKIAICTAQDRALDKALVFDVNKEKNRAKKTKIRDRVNNSYEILAKFYKLKDVNKVKFFNKNWLKSGFYLLAIAIVVLVSAPILFIIINIPVLLKLNFTNQKNSFKEKTEWKSFFSKIPDFFNSAIKFVLYSLLAILISLLIFTVIQIVTTIIALCILPVALFRLATIPVGLVYEGAKLVIEGIKLIPAAANKLTESVKSIADKISQFVNKLWHTSKQESQQHANPNNLSVFWESTSKYAGVTNRKATIRGPLMLMPASEEEVSNPEAAPSHRPG